MADITMCTNPDCPLRFNCYRQQAPVSDVYQAVNEFHPDEYGKCEYYLPMDEEVGHSSYPDSYQIN